MRTRIPTLVTLFLVLFVPAVRAQAPVPPPEGDLLVATGEATVKVAPDRALVTVSAEARARSPREALRQTAEAMTAVRTRLGTAGVAAEALRTLAYDLQPEFDYTNGRQVLKGYVARNQLEVTIAPVERVGEIIDAAVGAGATAVADVRFVVEDPGVPEREALRRAVTAARLRAEAMAKGAGREIARIVRIEEEGASIVPPPPPPVFRARAMAADAAPETPVSSGQIEVTARVRLTARLN
jgi:hypothetical protein